MDFTLEFFSNDRYKVLMLLRDNQIKVKDDTYISLSQQEMADMLHFAKVKTNKILKELQENGYVSCYKGTRGKYCITDKGYTALKLIQKNNR